MVEFRLIVIGIMLAACGGDDDRETGVCADRPCLTRIDDLADWAVISQPHARDARCDFLEESKFLAPATADAALQDVVFQDVGEHPLHLDFMTQVLPEFFGGLAPATYQMIVQRRATRQYWAGVLYRLVDEVGATTGYGFDVVVDHGLDEALTELEVTAIAAQLEARFHLPLAYAPIDSRAIFNANMFQTVVPHRPRACEFTPCPTPGRDCIVVPAPLPLCAAFQENRSIEDELANKAHLTLAAATLELPRELGTYAMPAIFGSVEVGAARTPLIPVGTGARYVVAVPPGGFRSQVYTQDFTLDGEPYEINLYTYEGGRRFDESLGRIPIAYLEPTGTPNNPRHAQLGSCTAANLEPWQIRGELPGGGRFTIDYGYWPMFFGSSPMFMTRGEVTLGGATAIVDDYFRLVYAGKHHNIDNQFWILFASPLTYDGHPVYGLWLDQDDFSSALESVHTLDAQRQPLDALDVTGYVVERLP